MRKNKVNIVLNVVLIILISVFIFVFVIFFKDLREMQKVKNVYGNVEQRCVSAKSKKKTDKKIDWNKLKKENDDIVAWLYIPGTKINYPIVKTRSNSFYLNHDIYGKYSKYGSIFFDERLYDNPFDSKNIIIYGHNMGHWTNLMFSTLLKYEDNSYFNKHRHVYFYTEKENLKLDIVSVRVVNSTSDAYNIYFEKGELKKWLNSACNKSIIPIKQREYNSKQVVTISTCTYDGNNRFVLHCIRGTQ